MMHCMNVRLLLSTASVWLQHVFVTEEAGVSVHLLPHCCVTTDTLFRPPERNISAMFGRSTIHFLCDIVCPCHAVRSYPVNEYGTFFFGTVLK